MTKALCKIGAAALILLIILMSSGSIPVVRSSFQEQTRELYVLLPMYSVMNQDGYDYVEIPGGGTMSETGEPMVPIYSLTLDLLEGESVQFLSISEKSGFTNATGLVIPVFEPFMDAGGIIPSPGGSSGGWFPKLELAWETWENSNGSSTLSITLYPFRYNANTTESSYCSEYTLEMIYVVTSARITGITSDKTAYDPGATASLEVFMENAGEAEDFVVGISIIRSGSLEVVDALPLRTLQDMQGSSSLQVEWAETDVKPGEYLAMAEMHDTGGHWLSTATLPIRVGIPKVEITAFSATPQHFVIGDQVVVETIAKNTGSVEVSGSYMVQVRGTEGLAYIAEINYTGLKPHQQRIFQATWDTSNAAEDELYTALAYIFYEGQATDTKSCILSTNQLPVAIIQRNPLSAWTALNITFDASSSYDPDGTITSYIWDFGDYVHSNGSVATHYYILPGNYSVTLTAVDAKGATGQARATIQVVMGYRLNVSSNIGLAVEGSGLYPEGAVAQATAPAESPVQGVMGILGSKYVFKQWAGASNSTDCTISLTVDYESSHLGLRAIYREESSTATVMIAVIAGVVALAAVVGVVMSRRMKKP